MRVLVEQTAASAEGLVSRACGRGAIAVHRLLGGVEADAWHLYPERPAVLIGTQDMLLSRALNRGYAAGRGRWPIDFALLNHDALWVMDEVQLMDVGLTTSVQLQAFRAQEAAKGFRPCHSWWISATLQPQWLETVEFADRLPALDRQTVRIPPTDRTDDLWGVTKPLRIETIPLADDKKHEGVAHVVLAAHDALSAAGPRVTLAVVNRVETATAVYDALVAVLRARETDIPDLRLVHSRFRPAERADLAERVPVARALCRRCESDHRGHPGDRSRRGHLRQRAGHGVGALAERGATRRARRALWRHRPHRGHRPLCKGQGRPALH